MKMHQVLMAALMATIALAGCVDNDDGTGDAGSMVPDDQYGPGFTPVAVDANGFPAPVLVCREPLDTADDMGQPVPGADTTRCNFEMTPDEGREGNEVTIAVNPTNPQNIVGGAKDYYEPDAGECVWNGVYVTHDGGRTAYQDRNFDGSPWRARDGDPSDFEQNYASTFWCTTDPVAYFDVNGNLYYLLMAYQTDPATGSDACQEECDPPEPTCAYTLIVCPHGSLNDWAFNRATQIIAVSDDGGDSFHTFTPVLEGTYPVNFHDRGWLAASADGTIHVVWLDFFVGGNQYCRSTDEGNTYLCSQPHNLLAMGIVDPIVESETGQSPSEATGIQGGGQGSMVDVGTDDQVYFTWRANGGFTISRSFDTGASWDDPRMVQGMNGASMPGLEARDRRGGHPAFATDRNPDSSFADGMYMVWQDACSNSTWASGCRDGGSGMWVVASHDEGETWSEPVRLSNPQPEGAGTEGGPAHDWNIFPSVSVSPGGVVDVSWMSTHGARMTACHAEAPDCEANYERGEYPHFEQHYAYSLDGGKTWSEPHSVRDTDDQGWDPARCHHQNGMVFIGDYNDIDSSWQAAHPVWPDSRLGPCDVFTATIQRPMFADGWDMEKRQDAEEWILAHPI